MIRENPWFCLVLSDAGFFGSLLTSFREIISVIGRIRVWDVVPVRFFGTGEQQ